MRREPTPAKTLGLAMHCCIKCQEMWTVFYQ